MDTYIEENRRERSVCSSGIIIIILDRFDCQFGLATAGLERPAI